MWWKKGGDRVRNKAKQVWNIIRKGQMTRRTGVGESKGDRQEEGKHVLKERMKESEEGKWPNRCKDDVGRKETGR